MGHDGGKYLWNNKFFFLYRSFNRFLYILIQESGQLSATDYVRITSTEWYICSFEASF